MDDRTAAERQLEYVEDLVRGQREWRGRRRDADRRKAFAVQLSTVTLSAVITVLLGLRVGDPVRGWFADAALVLGALITVLAAWSAFYSHRALWIQRSDTVHRLSVLERRIAYYRTGLGGDVPNPAQADEFLAEYEQIADDDHRSWTRIRQTHDPGQSEQPLAVALPSRSALPPGRARPPRRR